MGEPGGTTTQDGTSNGSPPLRGETLKHPLHADAADSLTRFRAMFVLSLVGLCGHAAWALRCVADTALPPDVQTYWALADAMKGPFATGMREPLIIWSTKLALAVCGPTALSIRAFGAILFIVACVLVYVFVLKMHGNRWVALFGMVLIGGNRFFLDLAVSGLRDAHFMVALLACLIAICGVSDRATGRQLALLAVALLLVVGTRITAYPAVVAASAIVLFRARVSFAVSLAVLSAALLFIAPYLWNSYSEFGDPFISINHHAKWWNNYENVVLKKTGCEGCATPEQTELNMYAGTAQPTAAEYALRRPLSSLVYGTAHGIAHFYLPTWAYEILFSVVFRVEYPFFIFGMWLLRRSPKFWIVFLTANLIVMPLFFALQFDMPIRLYTPLVPLHVAAVSVAAGACVARFWRRGSPALKRAPATDAGVV